MSSLAVYVPRSEEFYWSLLQLAVVYAILWRCALARGLQRVVAALVIALGGLVATAPALVVVVQEDVGGYGALARHFGDSADSDAFLAITGYLFVGGGTLHAALGMMAGLLGYVVVDVVRNPRRADQGSTT